MKLKIKIGVIILVVSLSGTVFAGNHIHNKMNSNLIMSGKMSMEDVEKKLMTMQSIMDDIQSVTDEREREKLLKRHMKKMHEGMEIMQGMVMEKMNRLKNMHEGKGGKPDNRDLQTRQNMMEQRMDVMQSIMGQMMNHMKEQNSMALDKK